MKNSLAFCYLALYFLFSNGYSWGQVTYQKTFGTAGAYSGRSSVSQTTDGGYVVSGGVYANGTTGVDAFLMKINSNGDVAWSKTYGSSNIDRAVDARQTSDGGYIVTGYSQDQPNSIFLLKTDMNGDTMWVRRFEDNVLSFYWGAVVETSDGGFLTAFPYTDGTYVIRIIKTDVGGNLLWEKQYGDSSTYLLPYAVRVTSDGGFIILGDQAATSVPYNCLLIKADALGNVQWSNTYGKELLDEYAYDAVQTDDGGYILNAFVSGQGSILLIRTNATGDTLWTRLFGVYPNSCFAASIKQTADGGFILAGGIGPTGAGSGYLHLIKTNSGGDTLWTRSIGSTGFNTSASSIQETSKGFIVAGGRGIYNTGNYQIYVAETDSFGHTGCDETHIMTAVNTDSIQVNPFYVPTTSLNSAANSFHISQGTFGNEGVLCYIAVEDPEAYEDFNVSPNPFNTSTTITLPSQQKIPTIKLFDELGREISFSYQSSQQGNKTQLTIERGNLANGMYFLSINSKEKSEVVKVMIE